MPLGLSPKGTPKHHLPMGLASSSMEAPSTNVPPQERRPGLCSSVIPGQAEVVYDRGTDTSTLGTVRLTRALTPPSWSHGNIAQPCYGVGGVF